MKGRDVIVARKVLLAFRDRIAALLEQDDVHPRLRQARGDGPAPSSGSDDDIVAVEPVAHQRVLRKAISASLSGSLSGASLPIHHCSSAVRPARFANCAVPK